MSRLLCLLPPAVLTAWLFAVALAGVAAHYEPVHAAAVFGLYLLLAAGLHAVTLAGARWAAGLTDRPWLARAVRWLAGFPAGLAAVMQLREQTFVPHAWWLVLVFSLLVGALYGEAVSRLDPGTSRGAIRAVGVAVGCAVLLVGALGLALRSETLRWHLLRHNTLLGTPVYYLTQTPAAERQAELFTGHDARALDGPSLKVTRAARDEATDERPHIVFVLLDTLRADALSAWRDDDAGPAPMPGLDAFLDEGYRLTDLWANSSWTRPSMVSFFTGLLPEEHGARDIGHVVADELVLLPEVLREDGYATVGFLTNVAALGSVTGFGQGFDFLHEFKRKPYARAEEVRRTVEHWLELPDSADALDSPLFLYLHFLDPHEPYLAGDAPWRKDPGQYRAAYRNELSYLDGELMPLLATVDERLGDRPAVYVFLSDHGEEFGEHELYGHGQSLYDELIHVPAGVVTRRMGETGSGDVAARLEGRDVFDLLTRYARGEAVSVPGWAAEHARDLRSSSVYYSREGKLALRPYLRHVVMRATDDGHAKLIWSAYGDTRELYAMQDDPLELDNLLDEKRATADALTEALDDPIRRWTLAQPYEATDDNLEQLRALGYID